MKNNQNYLDLRATKFDLNFDLEFQIIQILDEFLYPFLKSKKNSILRICVGKGLNSKRFIEGMHPLKYYTVRYLTRVGLKYRYSKPFDGGEGVLIVEIYN
jgi:hypothetical protein